MSTELEDAFTRASSVAQAEFATRNAADVITPATRRVARHRAAARAGAGLASVAVVGAMLWGAVTFADSRATPVGPAAPTSGGDDVVPAVPNNAWSTLDLAVRARPHAQGKDSDDPATGGMICHHAAPTDDPRLAAETGDPTVSSSVGIEDCRAVWYVDGPATSLTNWSISSGGGDNAFAYHFVIHNDSAQPISVDADSVFMWIETNPNDTTDSLSAYSHTLVATSMWGPKGDVTALLTSKADPATIAADGSYSSTITATTGSADGDALDAILSGTTPYRVSLWARVHEESPSGDATYLIQLGTDNDFALADSDQTFAP